MSIKTPTEILTQIKYELVQDVNTLWHSQKISNEKLSDTKPDLDCAMFKLKFNMLIRIISMEVANDK
jgi:hypothetical protein